MMQEYGGFLLSALAFLGISGQLTPYFFESLIYFGLVIVISFTLFWTFLYKRGYHIFLSAIFASFYILLGIVYFTQASLLGVIGGYTYLFSGLFVMKFTIGQIATKENEINH